MFLLIIKKKEIDILVYRFYHTTFFFFFFWSYNTDDFFHFFFSTVRSISKMRPRWNVLVLLLKPFRFLSLSFSQKSNKGLGELSSTKDKYLITYKNFVFTLAQVLSDGIFNIPLSSKYIESCILYVKFSEFSKPAGQTF